MIRRRTRFTLISIDPGYNGTGVVYWGAGVPVTAEVFRPPRAPKHFVASHTDVARAYWLAEAVFSPVGLYPTVVIEMPEFQAGAVRQMGWKTGDLQRLTLLVGILSGYAVATRGAMVELVTPSGWKGQLPKDAVERRMTAHYGPEVIASLGVHTHAWDALGIGAWAHQQPWMKKEK
jgi:hypothetical protein